MFLLTFWSLSFNNYHRDGGNNLYESLQDMKNRNKIISLMLTLVRDVILELFRVKPNGQGDVCISIQYIIVTFIILLQSLMVKIATFSNVLLHLL